MDYLLQIGLTVIVAIVTAYGTSKFAYGSEVKKYLYINREKLYFDLCAHLDLLIMNSFNVYDSGYCSILNSYKPKVKMCGSSKVINSYKRLLNLFRKYDFELLQFRIKNDPRYNEALIKSGINELGESFEYYDGNYSDIENYEVLEKQYIDENLPDSSDLAQKINEIINAMRKDLGNRKVKW